MAIGETTDEDRRLALQLAIQLPASVDRGRFVLALTSQLLDEFMVAPSTPAQRALQLGWAGIVRGEGVVRPRLSPPPCGVLVRSVLYGLCSLAVSLPISIVLLSQFQVGAAFTFGCGVMVVALIYGAVPALAVGLVSSVAHNLLLPPVLHLSPMTSREVVCGCGYVLTALLVPFLANRRAQIRRLTVEPPPRAAERPRLVVSA